MRRLPFTAALVAVTLLVWVNRLNNIWSDSDLDTGEQLRSSALAASFVVAALVVVGALWRARPVVVTRVVTVVAVWTAGVWAVRVVAIATGGWSVAFILVHIVLAVGSVALAGAAVREVRAAESHTGGVGGDRDGDEREAAGSGRSHPSR